MTGKRKYQSLKELAIAGLNYGTTLHSIADFNSGTTLPALPSHRARGAQPPTREAEGHSHQRKGLARGTATNAGRMAGRRSGGRLSGSGRRTPSVRGQARLSMANSTSTMFTDMALPIIALNSPGGTEAGRWRRAGRMLCSLSMASVPNRRPWVVTQ